jgi:ApbE superfamily uncharacterized protein (UPF0280 family)
MKSIRYEQRVYRNRMVAEGLISFRVVVEETDLIVSAADYLNRYVTDRVCEYRKQIKAVENPTFFTSLMPFPDDSAYPPIVRHMIKATERCGVGPMASVAGAIAEYAGRDLLEVSQEVLIENGGDIFLRSSRTRKIGVFAGTSPFSNRVSLIITPDETPMGICTSSGTVGHSFSYGKADAVVALSKDTLLSDAAATAVANLVHSKDDIPEAIEMAQNILGISGIVIIIGKYIGIWGNVRLTKE